MSFNLHFLLSCFSSRWGSLHLLTFIRMFLLGNVVPSSLSACIPQFQIARYDLLEPGMEKAGSRTCVSRPQRGACHKQMLSVLQNGVHASPLLPAKRRAVLPP